VRWISPVGWRRWPVAAWGLLAGAVGAVLMLGGWVTTAALAVLVAAGAALLLVTLVPAAWVLAAIAAVVVVVRPGGAPVIAGLSLFLGGALVQRRKWWRVAVGVVGAVVVGGALVLQGTHARPDGFYAAPGRLPAGHGVLVRSEPRSGPGGANAWRILYTTTRGDGSATVASAIVVAARQGPATPRPVVVWAHGATGITSDCAPSLGKDFSVPDLSPALANGWIVIAPDYPGLGTKGPHPFLIGPGEARSLLDAVLASRGLGALHEAAQTLVWGHSQGGNAALWAGIIAPAYTPEIDLKGVAALAPGTELPQLAAYWGNTIYSAYLAEAYSEAYPDVHFEAYARRAAVAREQAARCLDDSKVDLFGLSVLRGQMWKTAPDTGALGQRLRENVPDQPIKAPVLIGQGGADTTVPAKIQDRYVQQECATGTSVDYRTFPGAGHSGVLTGDSPDLAQWSLDRLEGKPAASSCPR
jgi:alpha-beta hydrolase superfamily lysophospholipase